MHGGVNVLIADHMSLTELSMETFFISWLDWLSTNLWILYSMVCLSLCYRHTLHLTDRRFLLSLAGEVGWFGGRDSQSKIRSFFFVWEIPVTKLSNLVPRMEISNSVPCLWELNWRISYIFALQFASLLIDHSKISQYITHSDTMLYTLSEIKLD